MGVATRTEHGYILYYDDTTGRTIDVITAGPKTINHFATVNEMYTDSTVNGSTSVISALGGGPVCLISTGAADNDDHDFTSLVQFDVTKGLTAECRMALGDVDMTAFNFGFSDVITEAADNIACMYSGSTLTSNATNCAVFFHDADATTDLVRAVAVNADTDGTVITASSTALVDYAIPNRGMHDYKVEIDPAGNCRFYYDFGYVGGETLGVAASSSTRLCAYCALINHGEAAANTAVLRYMHVWQWAA